MTEPLCEKLKLMRLDPFPINLWVIVTNDIGESTTNAAVKLGACGTCHERYGESDGAMTVSKANDGNIYLIFPFKANIAKVAHEVYHAVRHMAKFTGIDDGEFMAYYVGYLTEICYKYVRYQSKKVLKKK